MPNEEQNLAKLNQDRRPEPTPTNPDSIGTEEEVTFPWLIFFLAAIFDIICFFFPPLEIIAGLIFGFWQKLYVPKTDPLITFIVAKIIDALSLGILPSNIGIVVYAYIKKKAAAKMSTPLGKIAAKKIQTKLAT